VQDQQQYCQTFGTYSDPPPGRTLPWKKTALLPSGLFESVYICRQPCLHAPQRFQKLETVIKGLENKHNTTICCSL